jgi:hypothetical protein
MESEEQPTLITVNSFNDKIDYPYWLSIDLWEAFAALSLVAGLPVHENANIDRYRSFERFRKIESLINAGIATRKIKGIHFNQAIAFKPYDVIKFAIEKGLEIPTPLVEWYEAQQKREPELPPNEAHISKDLAILNRAAYEFWSTAYPEDKNTHTKQQVVIDWLKSQGFSDISAKQGAVIIRPDWAKK